MKLSENFWLYEFTQSQTAARLGLYNEPNDAQLANLIKLIRRVIQPVRDRFGPIVINSGFRGRALNSAVGGASTSQHTTGEAADIEVPGHSNKTVAMWIRDNLDFDQLILEAYNPAQGPNSGWIHVSYASNGRNRKEVLTATFIRGRAHYSRGINV